MNAEIVIKAESQKELFDIFDRLAGVVKLDAVVDSSCEKLNCECACDKLEGELEKTTNENKKLLIKISEMRDKLYISEANYFLVNEEKEKLKDQVEGVFSLNKAYSIENAKLKDHVVKLLQTLKENNIKIPVYEK